MSLTERPRQGLSATASSPVSTATPRRSPAACQRSALREGQRLHPSLRLLTSPTSSLPGLIKLSLFPASIHPPFFSSYSADLDLKKICTPEKVSQPKQRGKVRRDVKRVFTEAYVLAYFILHFFDCFPSIFLSFYLVTRVVLTSGSSRSSASKQPIPTSL